MINFTVPGTPVGKARPRVTRSGRVYTPESTAQAEQAIRQAAQQAMHGLEPMEGPLVATLAFIMPIPTSWSKRHRDDALTGVMAHTSRPDLDNLIKTVLDALNGIAYTDDKQIVRLGATKAYGTDPKILISIRAA